MERPSSIPESAVWNPEANLWEQGTLKDGQRDGGLVTWRPDGSRHAEFRYREGVLNGPFRVFHESGDVAREGRYKNGLLQGTEVWTRTDGATSLVPFDGTADTVWRSEVDYEGGRVAAIRHYDRQRNRVLPDGTPLPEQPRGVPSLAEFEEETGRWVHGQSDAEGRRVGLWMWWNRAGSLVEESEYREGVRQGRSRRYDDDGSLVEEGAFDDDLRSGTWTTYDPATGKPLVAADYDEDVYHGSVIEYGADGRSRVRAEYEHGVLNGQYLARVDKSTYRGGRIRVENGQYKQGVPVGRWKFLDKSLEPVMVVDFGVLRKSDDDPWKSPALDDANRTPEAWDDVAARLEEARFTGEALIAFARSAAREGDAERLTALVGERCLPLASAAADALMASLDDAASPTLPISALLRGAPAARVLADLGRRAQRNGRTRCASDLLGAALLLSPLDGDLLAQRVELSIDLGDDEDALALARKLSKVDIGRARAVEAFVDVLFGPYAALPPPRARGARLDVALARSAEELEGALHDVAAALGATRSALLGRLDFVPSWLPPDPTPLLGDGVVDTPPSGSLGELLGLARAQWEALVALSWAAGARRPMRHPPCRAPAELGAARSEAEARDAACAAVLSGRPPEHAFEDGVPVDEMPTPMLRVVARQWRLVSALLRWASDASAPFPDLR